MSQSTERGSGTAPWLVDAHIQAAAPSVFVGRTEEIDRLRRGLRDVPLAAIAGLAGVGKSALARAIGAAWDGPVTRHQVAPGQPLAELLDDLRRTLAPEAQGTPELQTDLERLKDAAGRLDRDAALAIVDDVDRLGEVAPELLGALAALLRRGRVIVTSRTRFLDRADGPERVEVVLGGLDEASARTLWSRLDDLYGARPGFEAAWERTHGNPFFLRRAHAGDLEAADPVGTTVASLDPAERRLALALALVGAPVPREAAARLSPPQAAREAMRGLVAKLVVEPTGCGELVVHDLLAQGLRAAASAEELVAGHRAVADALEGAPLGLIAGTRLRVRHMVAAGMIRSARDLLLARAPELVRSGGAGDLLRGLDLVTSDGDAEARLARARVMARMLDFGRAYDEVLALGADRPGAEDSLRATFAQFAMLTLRLDVAERVSRGALLVPGLSPELRARFATVYLIVATFQGNGDDARAAIDRAAHGFSTQPARGYIALSRAFSLWLEERDAEAERAMRAAWALFQDTFAFRTRVMAPTFMVSVLARAGKVNDAEAALAEAEAVLARFDDPLMRVSLRALRATLLESQGDFAAARDQARSAEDTWSRAGCPFGVLWTKLVRARATLYCGQVRAGAKLLDEIVREAEGVGASLIARLAARARRGDALHALTGAPSAESSRPGELRRERVIAVLRSAAAGQIAVARGYLAAIDRHALDPLERALVAVAEWALEATEGEAPAADDPRVRIACEDAARAGADPELIPAIVAALRDQLTRRDARPEQPARAIVVDRRSDSIRADAVVVELGHRPALRRLLYALLEAPERRCSRAALARAIWAVEYRPAVHDGALWVNVKRLRALLAPAGLRVASDEDGVRLRLEPGRELHVIPS